MRIADQLSVARSLNVLNIFAGFGGKEPPMNKPPERQEFPPPPLDPSSGLDYEPGDYVSYVQDRGLKYKKYYEVASIDLKRKRVYLFVNSNVPAWVGINQVELYRKKRVH